MSKSTNDAGNMTSVANTLSDEDIEVTEVAWVPLVDLERRLAYADERKLARRAMRLLGPNGSGGRARDAATGTVDEAERT